MKRAFFFIASAATLLSSCITLENRRDMYSPQKVNGPYTRMLKHGIPKPHPVEGTIVTGASDGKAFAK